MNPKLTGIFLFLFLIVGLGVIAPLYIDGLTPQKLDTGIPVYGRVPEFQLIDSENSSFGKAEMLGKVSVVNFFFSSCEGPCPVMGAYMSSMHKEFFGNENVAFTSVTVDPEIDTPEVLAAYAEKFGADTSKWHFLTGDIEVIRKLAIKGFKIAAGEDRSIHSTRFILVDSAGKVRGYYHGTDIRDVNRLRTDLRRLASAATS